MRYLIPIMAVLLAGCISATSQTGTETQAQIQARQQSSQASNSSDSVKLEIDATIITAPDGSIIRIGGGRADTGSTQSQVSEQLSKISAKADAAAEASSKASINMSWVIYGVIALLLISGGSRLLALIRKFTL